MSRKCELIQTLTLTIGLQVFYELIHKKFNLQYELIAINLLQVYEVEPFQKETLGCEQRLMVWR